MLLKKYTHFLKKKVNVSFWLSAKFLPPFFLVHSNNHPLFSRLVHTLFSFLLFYVAFATPWQMELLSVTILFFSLSVLVEFSSLPIYVDEPKNFIADHPFIFTLNNKKFNSRFFLGRYAGNWTNNWHWKLSKMQL